MPEILATQEAEMRRIEISSPGQSQKRTHVVEHLLSKREVLNSIPSTEKKKKNNLV
jgi:hypothetical protein